MTNRFQTPDEQFLDATGTPYAGGFLFFYQAGTSNLQATYSDVVLSSPNANPIILDSAGRAGSVFLQNLDYKVVLQDKNSAQIWSLDHVRASDFSTTAQFSVFAGNPNGSVAGTAGSGSTPSSVIWDTTDNQLFVCTTTGNAAAAIWTSINPAASATTPPPQGYLTPTSGVPIIPADATAQTALFYTPYVGTQVPLPNGSGGYTITAFAELTLTLASQHAADTVYDVFLFSNGGVLTLATGPAWFDLNHRISGGTGPAGSSGGSTSGTSALTRIGGLWVNAAQLVGARNGASTFNINAQAGLYVGSFYTDHTAGQVSLHRSYGQNRKFGVWNAYNRSQIVIKAGDSTASWAYSTATWRASNAKPASFTVANYNAGSGTTCNGLSLFAGLAEEEFQLTLLGSGFWNTNTSSGTAFGVGIGYNTITSPPTASAGITAGGANTTVSNNQVSGFCNYSQPPALGVNIAASMENAIAAGTNQSFSGAEQFLVLTAIYRG